MGHGLIMDMLNVLGGFAIVLIIIALGVLVGRRRLLGPQSVYTLNMFVFWIALPATLINFLIDANFSELFGTPLAVAATSGLTAGTVGYLGYRFLTRRRVSDSLVAMIAASYCNGSNLGIPLATHLLDDPTLTLPVILFQVGFYGPATVLLLDIATQREKSSHAQNSTPARTKHGALIRELALSIVRNPLVLAVCIGMTLSFLTQHFGFTLPEIIAEPITIISSATVGVALIAFGASMAEVKVLERGRSPIRAVLAASAIKTIIHPLAAILIGTYAFNATGPALLAMALLAALPTGQNVFAYAQRFDVNTVLARDVAVVSTVMALPVMVVIMLLLG